MKKILTILLAVCLLAGVFAACGSSAPASTEKQKLIVGFDAEFPPYGFIASDGSYDGFDLAMAKRGLLGTFKDDRAARAADVDGNATNDILDFMLLWKYIHALIPGFDQNTVG